MSNKEDGEEGCVGQRLLINNNEEGAAAKESVSERLHRVIGKMQERRDGIKRMEETETRRRRCLVRRRRPALMEAEWLLQSLSFPPMPMTFVLLFLIMVSQMYTGESLATSLRPSLPGLTLACRTGQQRIQRAPFFSQFVAASPALSRLHVSFAADGSESLQPESSSSSHPTVVQLASLRVQLTDALQKNDFSAGLVVLQQMTQSLQQQGKPLPTKQKHLASQCLEDAFQHFVRAAFSQQQGQSNRYQNRRQRLLLGVEAIQLQTNSHIAVPRQTLLHALRALTNLHELTAQRQLRKQANNHAIDDAALDASFRILQRLITGVGVRKQDHDNNNTKSMQTIGEKDFNRVLNAFSNAGRMDMAHRIVALQERTDAAPPLSPVAYSILLKGYGRLHDLPNVDFVLHSAEENGIVPDTILLNSLMDAYINCDALETAQGVFAQMKQGSANTETIRGNATETATTVFSDHPCPPPNRRTFNIMLKGLANAGRVRDVLDLSNEMKQSRLWDSVTTNTIVHAAVIARVLDLAHEILEGHTFRSGFENTEEQRQRRPQHPNVEAYTELLEAYAKNGQLEKALGILQLMRDKAVEPNEITYACLVAGMARHGNMEQVRRTLAYMASNGIRPTHITCNALISSIVCRPHSPMSIEKDNKKSRSSFMYQREQLDARVDDAFTILRDLMKSGTRPNVVTVLVMVEALGRCRQPRITEAALFVDKLEREGVIPVGNAKVVTAMVRACGEAGDIKRAVEAFRKLAKPDVMAINAFLDVCCKNEHEALAIQTFDYYFRNKKKSGFTPDVITYSVLISSLLRSSRSESISRAHKYYQYMREKDKILPDCAMVDIILRGMLHIGRSKTLSRREASLVAAVLRDAERLRWEEGQLERRKRAVRAVLSEQLRGVWKQDDDLSNLLDNPKDNLFERKGWNRVDSGFSLWGKRPDEGEAQLLSTGSEGQVVDKFLSSRGWNNIDSGFRVL